MTNTSNARHEDVRRRALDDLRRFDVVMEGHFDYGNGFHGKLYLNPHQLFQLPSTIWRVAQDLIELMPSEFALEAEVVAGPATGGALLAHTIAGLLDGRRPMTHPPYWFAPMGNSEGKPTLSDFYKKLISGRKVLLADDVRNTGHTLKRCADLVRAAGGTVIGTVEIVDRCEALVTLDVPNVALIEYKAPPNFAAATCPMCASNLPITTF
ncbi:MAG: phosphoribosyltransferase family protein [Vicinamibacterales bacterium]